MPRHTRKHKVIPPGPKVCHPRLIGHNEQCITSDILQEIGNNLGAPVALNDHSLREWIRNKTRCKTERCWVDRSNMNPEKKKQIIKKYFRPDMPDEWKSDPDQWLDSNNINEVMKQYEEIFPDFKYYGSNPIDFSSPDPYDPDALSKRKCLNDSICKLHLNDLLSKGITRLGFVYNLDPSNKGGSHWIASFTDIPGHRTYYFDSYGMKPPPQIARFMRSLTLQDSKMKLEYNAIRFQYGDTECGMYCLYFLIRMLAGDNFREFCRSAPRDPKMLELRKWLFSPKNE